MSYSVKLRYISLQSQDLSKASNFYKEIAGLSMQEKADDFVKMKISPDIALCLDLGEETDSPLLIFSVTNLNELCEKLKSASFSYEGPFVGIHHSYVTVRDPDGNVLVFEELEPSP